MIITVQRNEWHASQKIAEKIELLVTNRHCQEMNIVRAHFWSRWSLGQHPPQIVAELFFNQSSTETFRDKLLKLVLADSSRLSASDGQEPEKTENPR